MYEGLGVTYNIAAATPTLRQMQQFAQQWTTAPVVSAPVARTPTPTTVFRAPVPTVKPIIPTVPVFKPSVLAVSTQAPVLMMPGAGVAPVEPSITDGALSPTKSPLPLILAGLVALVLVTKKGRR